MVTWTKKKTKQNELDHLCGGKSDCIVFTEDR